MLLARLDALQPEARRTLQLASVVGMEFPETTVVALSEADADQTDAALRDLQRSELVTAGSREHTLVFRHPLIHEVAYGSLLLSTRRALHGRIGAWIEEHGGEEQIAELARHYRDSDDPAKAGPLSAAGRRAGVGAEREPRGLRLVHRCGRSRSRTIPMQRAEMIEAAAHAALPARRHQRGDGAQQEEAIALFESVGAERAALSARRWLGRFRWLLGDKPESQRQIDLAIEGLERLGPSPELAMAYSFRSQSVMLEPDFEAGEKWARKAIEIAEQTDATAALVHAYNNLGACLMWQGDLEGADYLRRSLDLALEHHLPDDVGRAYANLSGQGNRYLPVRLRGVGGAADRGRRVLRPDDSRRGLRPMDPLRLGRIPPRHRPMGGGGAGDLRRSTPMPRRRTSAAKSAASAPTSSRGRADTDEAGGIATVAAETSEPAWATSRRCCRRWRRWRPPRRASARTPPPWRASSAESSCAGRANEATISAWYLFEVTDTLSTIAARDPSSAALRDGLESVAAFARALGPEAARPGDLVLVAVGQALLRCGGRPARAIGVPPPA